MRVMTAYNPFWVVLAMGVTAAWLHFFLRGMATRRARIIGLITAFGLFAFAFSFFSPDDDLVQREFVQSHKIATQNSRKALKFGNELTASVAVWTPQATGLHAATSVLGNVWFAANSCFELTLAHPNGDRAPPGSMPLQAA